MSTSASSASATRPRRVQGPKSIDELLDREEALALATISDGFERFGDDVMEDSGLRRAVREHPILSTTLVAAIAAGCGYLAGPALVRAVAGKWDALSRTRAPARAADPSGATSPRERSSATTHHHLVSVAMRAMRAVMTAPRR